MKKLLSFFCTLTIGASTLSATACGYKDKKILSFERKAQELATILFPFIASDSTDINLKTLTELIENKKIGKLNPRLQQMGYLSCNKSYEDIFEGLMFIGYKEGLDFFYENLFNSYYGIKNKDWREHGSKNINFYSSIQKIFDLLNIVVGAIKSNIFNPTTIARMQILLDNLNINSGGLSKNKSIINIVVKIILNLLELTIDFKDCASKWIDDVIKDIEKDIAPNLNYKITNQSFVDYILIQLLNCFEKEDNNNEDKIKENIITKENFITILNKIDKFIKPIFDLDKNEKYLFNINNLNKESIQKILASLIIIFSNISLDDNIKPIDGDHVFSNEKTNTNFLCNFWKINEFNHTSSKIIEKFNNNLKILFTKFNNNMFLKIYNILFSVNFDDDKDEHNKEWIRNIFKNEERLDLDYIHYKNKYKEEKKPPHPDKEEYFSKEFKNNVGFFLITNTFIRKILIDLINVKTNILADLLFEYSADKKLAEKIQILLSLIGKGVDMTSIKYLITSGQEIDMLKLGSKIVELKINAKLGYKDDEQYFDKLFKNKENNLISSLYNGDLLNKIIDVNSNSLNEFETKINIKFRGKSINLPPIGESNLLKKSLPPIANSFRNFFRNEKQWNLSSTFSIISNMFKMDNQIKHLNIFNEFNNAYLDLKENKKNEIAENIKNINNTLFNKVYKVIEKENNKDNDEDKNDILGFVTGLKENNKIKQISLLDLLLESLSNKNIQIYDANDKTKLICNGKDVTLFILGLSANKQEFTKESIFENLNSILKSEQTKKFIEKLDEYLIKYKNNYKKIQDEYLKYINYENYLVEINKNSINDYQYNNGMLIFYITYKNPDTNISNKYEIGICEIDDKPYGFKKTIVKKFKKLN